MRAAALAVVVLLGAFYSAGVHARPCATMALREAVRDGALPLSSLALQSRPAAAGYIDSTTLPVRVHYETEAVAVRAPEVLALVEEAWTTLVTDMGFPAPLPDDGEGGDERFDVYLVFAGSAAALTIAGADVSDDDGRAAAYAHMRLSPTLDASAMPTFVHHEMAHAVQFALDLEESVMFAEASAVAYERLALPGVSAWADSLEDFQSYPQAPLFTNGIDWEPIAGEENLYDYGAALFFLYLEQEHGDFDGTLIRRLWQASAQEAPALDGGVRDVNEPDWLDVIEDVSGASLDDLVLDFASWRVLLGAWSTGDDGLAGGASLPGTALVRSFRLIPSSLDGEPFALPRTLSPHQLGCATLEVDAVSESIPLHVDVASVPADDAAARPLGVAWVIGNPDESRAERGRADDVAPALRVDLEVPAGDRLLLAICDLGPADADELPRGTTLSLSLHDENLPRYDAGTPTGDAGPSADAGAPDDDAGVVCGCQQVPSRSPSRSAKSGGPFAAIRPYAAVAMSVLGLLILFARGRKVIARRRLYKEGAGRRREP